MAEKKKSIDKVLRNMGEDEKKNEIIMGFEEIYFEKICWAGASAAAVIAIDVVIGVFGGLYTSADTKAEPASVQILISMLMIFTVVSVPKSLKELCLLMMQKYSGIHF